MRFFGWEVSWKGLKKRLETVTTSGAWQTIFDHGGGFQSDVKIDEDKVVLFGAVYACVSLISQDVGKMRLRLMESDGRVWREVTGQSPFLPVLRKPNRYQNRLQFIENWVQSKLLHGNTYVLKIRDGRGLVRELYVLDPQRVSVLVADDGSVFYRLSNDNLAALDREVVVPADEIIHDRMNAFFHPLVGVSPIRACGLAATQGLKIQNNSTKFFENMSRPSGVLTAPGTIAPETAERIKKNFEENFGGTNIGKLMVAGDGLKYEAMTISAVDAQLLEQLKWTAENVASTFHVPPYKIGIGPTPSVGNVESLNQIYYSDCLQEIIEAVELSLDDGLALHNVENRTLGTEFDLRDLLRMDSATRFKTWGEGVKAGILSPNEPREWEDLPAVEGGGTPYLQQQNFSLSALAKRDAREDPFAPPKPPELPPSPEPEADEEEQDEPTPPEPSARGAEVALTAQELMRAVARGECSALGARAAMAAAYPELDASHLERMFAHDNDFAGFSRIVTDGLRVA